MTEFRFGPFLLDQGGLSKDGKKAVALGPSVGPVLWYLVEHRGCPCTKRELASTCGSTENAVRGIIHRMRKLLEETEEAPCYLYRVGDCYQFIDPAAPSPPRGAGEIFVGRREELEKMRLVMEGRSDPPSQVIFMSGEQGIGKRSLWRQASAHSKLWQVPIRCYRESSLGHALRELVEYLYEDPGRGGRVRKIMEQHAPTWLLQVRSFPEGDRDRLKQRTLGSSADARVADLADALERLADVRRPVALFFEDLHFGDPLTIELATLLCKRSRQTSLIVACTFCPEENPALHSQLSTLAVARGHLHIELAGLDRGEVEELLTLRLSDGVSELAPLLHARTEGHPMYLLEIVNWLEANPKFAIDSINLHHLLPPKLVECVRGRLTNLESHSLEMLQACSVAGTVTPEFSAAAAAAALGQGVVQTDRALKHLAEARQFLVEHERVDLSGGGCGRYSFTHSLHQSVLYNQIAHAQRDAWHRSIAERFNDLSTPLTAEQAAEVAHHLRASNDHAHAIEYLIRAAREESRCSTSEAAIHFLTQASEMLGQLRNPDQRIELEMHLLAERGVIHRSRGDRLTAAAMFERLARLAQQQRRTDMQAIALLCWAEELAWGDFAQTRTKVEQALRLSELVSDEAVRVHVRGAYGFWVAMLDGWQPEHSVACEQAVKLGPPSIGLAPGGWYTRHVCCLLLQGRYQEASDAATIGLHRALHVNDFSDYMNLRYFQGYALLVSGQLGTAIDSLTEAHQAASTTGHSQWKTLMRLGLLWAHQTCLSFPDEQLTECEEILRWARSHDEPLRAIEEFALILKGCYFMGRGVPAQAMECFAELMTGPRPQLFMRLALHFGLSECRLRSGRIAAARIEAEQLRQLAMASGEKAWIGRAHRILCEAALQEEDRAQAEQELVQGLAEVEGGENPLAEYEVCATASMVWRAWGRGPESARCQSRCRELVAMLAGSLSAHPNVRSAFLAHPFVRLVADQT